MAPRGAPIALRMPISRVRSVTVTSMMLVMPMPPTSSEIAATAPSSTVNVLACWCWPLSRLAWLRIRKSALACLMPCRGVEDRR